MTSYVFTILEKRYHWEKVFESLEKKHGKAFEIVLVVNGSHPDKEEVLQLEGQKQNVKAVVLEKEVSENQMVAQGIAAASGQDLVLCRDGFGFKTILSDFMLEMGKDGAQLVVYRKVKKTSKIRTFFNKIFNKVVKQIFGFKLYGAEIGLMYFNNVAFSVLKQLPNSALLTKVNKWAGFDASYVDIEPEEIEVKKPQRTELKKLYSSMAIAGAVFAGLVGGFVLLAVFNALSFIVGTLIVFVALLVLFLIFYLSLKIAIVSAYGNLR